MTMDIIESRPMKIYIAGPYGKRNGLPPEQLQANVDTANRIAYALILKGHYPFVPHNYHYVDAVGDDVSEERWLEICKVWVPVCQAIFLMEGWFQSIGAFQEWQMASAYGKKQYRSLEEVPDVSLA